MPRPSPAAIRKDRERITPYISRRALDSMVNSEMRYRDEGDLLSANKVLDNINFCIERGLIITTQPPIPKNWLKLHA